MKKMENKSARSGRSASEPRADDLFDESTPVQAQSGRRVSRSIKEKKKSRSMLLPTLILIAAIAIGSLAGVLYLNHKDSSLSAGSSLTALKTAIETEHNEYVEFINSATKPDDWSDEAMNTLREAALNAYDLSQLEQVDAAINGDSSAQAALKDVSEPAAQPEQVEKFRAMFTSLSSYPATIANLAAGNPDMIDFVLSYPENAGGEGDVNATIDTSSIQNLKTFDPRWAYVSYGDGMFVETGSAPVAISTLFSYLLQDGSLNPLQIANWAREYGYDTTPIREDSTIFSAAALTYGVTMNPLMPYRTQIDDALMAGDRVIIQTGDKFEVITGLDENGNWIIQNPKANSEPTAMDPNAIADTVESAYAFWVD